jgi:hypothetical protein
VVGWPRCWRCSNATPNCPWRGARCTWRWQVACGCPSPVVIWRSRWRWPRRRWAAPSRPTSWRAVKWAWAASCARCTAPSVAWPRPLGWDSRVRWCPDRHLTHPTACVWPGRRRSATHCTSPGCCRQHAQESTAEAMTDVAARPKQWLAEAARHRLELRRPSSTTAAASPGGVGLTTDSLRTCPAAPRSSARGVRARATPGASTGRTSGALAARAVALPRGCQAQRRAHGRPCGRGSGDPAA